MNRAFSKMVSRGRELGCEIGIGAAGSVNRAFSKTVSRGRELGTSKMDWKTVFCQCVRLKNLN